MHFAKLILYVIIKPLTVETINIKLRTGYSATSKVECNLAIYLDFLLMFSGLYFADVSVYLLLYEVNSIKPIQYNY